MLAELESVSGRSRAGARHLMGHEAVATLAQDDRLLTLARGVYAHAPATALEQIVALRVHLDDSLAGNGPLRVLPGTHRRGVLSDAEISDLALRIHPHECTVARGDIVAMRPLLVHASSKAVIPSPRRVLHIEYAAAFRLGSQLELEVA